MLGRCGIAGRFRNVGNVGIVLQACSRPSGRCKPRSTDKNRKKQNEGKKQARESKEKKGAEKKGAEKKTNAQTNHQPNTRTVERNGTKRKETRQNETKRNETKRTHLAPEHEVHRRAYGVGAGSAGGNHAEVGAAGLVLDRHDPGRRVGDEGGNEER